MHLHFDPHTFLILLGLIPLLMSFFTKKIKRKTAIIIAIVAVLGFIGDVTFHSLGHHHN
jgi:hypothetical protein